MRDMLLHLSLRKSITLKLASFLIMSASLLFATSISAQNDLWLQKGSLGAGSGSSGPARSGAVSFSIDGNIYIALGKDNSNYYDDVWAFDTITETWAQKPSFIGAGRAGAFSMVIGGVAVVGTGETAEGLNDSVFIYSESSGWTISTPMPVGGLSFATAFSTGTKGYVQGGKANNTLTNALWQFSSGAWTVVNTSGDTPSPRMKAIAFTIGDSVYYGTGNTAASVQEKDLYLLNTLDPNKEWVSLTMPNDFSIREGAIAASTQEKGYIGFGSYIGTRADNLSDFWVFDPATNVLELVGASFIGNSRELAIAGAIGDRVFMGTGYGGAFLKDFYEYDACAKPQITVQPVGDTLCEGEDYTLSVEIINTGSETYQWSVSGSDIAGATSSTLELIAVTGADGGSYKCEITIDPCGTNFTEVAEVTVIQSPQNPPTNVTANPEEICPGNSFDLTLTADDNGFSYETLKWYSDACGIGLVGTGASLVLDAPSITTDYFVRWENQCGESECDTINVLVKANAEAPISVTRSLDTICNNFNDELFLAIEGGSGDSVMWYLGDICTDPSAVFMGSGDTLDLFADGIVPTETSTYSVRWETYCGGDEFNSTCLLIDVFVNGEFTIVHPSNPDDACNGGVDTVFFAVQAFPGESLTDINYQWLKDNGTVIADAITDTLWINNVVASDSGYYYCKVYNTCDTIYSDSAFLTVNILPTILIQPFLLDTICEEDSITFTVQADGTPVLQYQWFFNNSLTSSTDTFLTINPATFVNTGDYYCQVSNGCGILNSDTVSMEVDSIPVVIQQPTDQTVCLNGTAEFEVATQGTLPVFFQWYKIENATNTSTSLDGETGNILQITPAQATDTAYRYYCILSNECSDGPSSDSVSLSMYPQVGVMDSIVSDTNHICHTYQSYINLTVVGGEGDSIRWYTGSCEGIEIALTIDTTLQISVPDVTTTYYARWENICGISVCDSILIDVVQDAEPIESLVFEDNQICQYTYDSLLLTAYGGEGDSIFWYEGFNCNGTPFAITADTFVYIHNIPSNSSPYAAKWVNTCGESACTVGNLFINQSTFITDQTHEISVCENTSAEMSVTAEGHEPLLYQWSFYDVELAGMVNASLIIDPVTFADTGLYYCQVRSECDTVMSDSIHLTMQELPYFSMQPTDVSVCAGSFDTIQAKIAGASPLLVQWFMNGLPLGSPIQDDTLLIIDPAVNTANYYAVLTNGCGNINSDTISFRVFDSIVITQQPQYQNLCLLETASFDIGAHVTEFAQYEWYKIGNANPVGTGSNLTIPNLEYSDAGEYYCIVSDTCGEKISDTVLLNMNRPPQVENDPYGPVTICEGVYSQFQVEFVGDSVVFDWFHDGTVITPSVNDSILRFDPVERGDEGLYYVTLHNNCGSDATIPAQLNVDYMPNAIDSLLAVPDTICPSCDLDYITLTAFGDGGGYGDYIEWYIDVVDIDHVIDTGRTIQVELPTQTTMYYAYWINDCAPSGSGLCGGSCSGGGGGGGGGLGVQVYYQENPEAPTTISVDVNNFCITYGDSITLYGGGGYGDRLEWNIIDGSDEIFIGYGDAIKVVQPLDTTIYAASYVNMCGKSDSLTIQVNVIPLPEASLIAADTICAGQIYYIDSLTSFIQYYESVFWTSSSFSGAFENPDTLLTNYYDPVLSLHDTTLQTLYLTTDGISPCAARVDSINLVIWPIPELSLNPELTAVCRDSSITLTGFGAVDYIWKPLEEGQYPTDENPYTLSPIESTDYYLIGENIHGCLDSVSFTLDVFATPMVDLGDSIYLYSCEPVQLDAGGGDGSEYYIWNNGNRTRSITVYETGTYSVIVGNAGCKVSDTGFVSLCNGKLFMPNAFSPNEDGINEVLKPITSDPTIEFHMMIFDRWGKLIFETYDIHEGWDGNIDGEPCPTGNYVYRLEYQGQGTDSPGKKASEVGTVMLVR